MKTILALACLALASCKGYPAMFTANLSGSAYGQDYNVGFSVPVTSGKEAKKVTP
ncbi:MAG: hypothetical protein JWO08_2181 [Verrucomicrobiaceae bacterium]|nr:hypothetical protein [Verrucomicrobiaceae bacterium]